MFGSLGTAGTPQIPYPKWHEPHAAKGLTVGGFETNKEIMLLHPIVQK